MPLVGLFTSNIAEFSGITLGVIFIATPPPTLSDPMVEEMKVVSN